MGNLLQYTDKSKIIDEKVNSMLAAVQYDYNNGNIKTEAEYYYRIKNLLTDFYKSLTNPIFKFRPAVTTPISSEYNSMINEAYNDMKYIISDCEMLKNFVSRSFSDAELTREMMSNKLNMMSKKITSMEAQSSIVENPDGTVVITELFSDTSQTGNSLDDKALCIDTTNSFLRLKSWQFTDLHITNVTIDENESNGLPGTSHTASNLNGELYFDGQDKLHNDISSIIDDNDDTWFEFETFNITDTVKSACNSYGFEYEEGVSWITNDQVLRLKLVLYTDSSIPCTWVTLKPYLSEIKGIKNSYIEKCDIITTENTTYRVAENIAFDENIACVFPAHTIQRVEITFIQPSKYLTKVGHFYYTSVDTSNVSLFQESDDTDLFSRVDGPKPSVGLLGCKYDPKTQWVVYQQSINKDEYDSVYSKARLFEPFESTVDRKSAKETVEAYRYMIGIRDISLVGCTFVEDGEYVSIKYETEEEITSVSLEADEYIPIGDAESIKYFISFDNGVVWHKIYPVHRAYMGIYKYFVNNDSIANQLGVKSDRRTQGISVLGRADHIQLKITMERDKNMPYVSPIVNNYRLKLTVGGETYEY